ncbi:hypothetical protein FQN49_007702 [Arthroderma sp. PD_2]|nr:hypothetical protein FQN49_007702 [Arthroderma sp. PD_2]
MPSKPLSSIAGYSVLPVQLPATSSFLEPATHYFYIQPHTPRIPDADSPRSLFVVNIPTTSTETHFRHLFGTQLASGRVERVDFHYGATSSTKPTQPPQASEGTRGKKRKRETAEDCEKALETIHLPPAWDRELRPSGSHAVVTFVDRPSMEASLKAVKKASKPSPTTITWGEGIEHKLPQLGMSRYTNHLTTHRYPSRSDLLRSVNEYMTVFTRLEEAQAAEAAKQTQIPDEDGFITVTRGPKRSRDDGKEEELKALAERQREKNKGLGDFYRFQMREKRKERQGELLRKFEEDKRRVEEMKKRRGRVMPES